MQAATLRYLDASHGYVRTAALAAHLSLPLSRAAELVDRMARMGVVARDRDPRDGRNALIQITDQGIERLHGLWQTLRLEVELIFQEHTGSRPPA